MATSLSVGAVVFPVSTRHQGAACSLLYHYISTISQYLVQDTSASAVVLRRGTVHCLVSGHPPAQPDLGPIQKPQLEPVQVSSKEVSQEQYHVV